MAKSKLSNQSHFVNIFNSNVSLVSHQKLSHFYEMGFRHLMVAVPDTHIFDQLKPAEKICLKYHIEDEPPKAIALSMNITERQVQRLLSDMRAKFKCRTNSGLVSLFYRQGQHLPFNCPV